VRALLPIGILAAAAASALAVFAGGDAPEPHAAAALPERVTPPPTAPATGCVVPPGTRLAYEVRTNTQVSIDMSELMGQLQGAMGAGQVGLAATPARNVRLESRFRLELEAVESPDDGSTVLAAAVRGPSGKMDGAPTDLRQGDLDPVFLVRLDARCGVADFARRREADLQGARQQQGMVAELGWRAPASAEEPDFEARGFDLTGRYTAIYRARDAAILGRVMRYDAVFNDDARGRVSDVPVRASSLKVVRGASPWFESLVHGRDLSFLTHGVEVATTRLSVRARAVEPGEALPEHASPDDADWVWGLLLAELGGSSLPQKSEVNAAFGALPLAAAFERFEAMVGVDGANPAEYLRFMRDWLRQHPEAMATILRMIREGYFAKRSRVRAALFLALAEANTEASRQALMDILDDASFEFGYRMDAAHVLTLVEPPPDGFIERLLGFAQGEPDPFLRGAMRMTTGMMASQQAKLRPEVAEQLTEEISGWLEQAEARDEVIHALQAAGNAGQDALAEAVGGKLAADEDPQVRRHAAKAMRNMSSETVMPALESAYLDEAEAGVRMAILRSAAQVTGRRGEAPPRSFVRAVGDAMGETNSDAEFHRATVFLGRAAKAGDQNAAAALKAQLDAEMRSERRNLKRIQALGSRVNTRWKAR